MTENGPERFSDYIEPQVLKPHVGFVCAIVVKPERNFIFVIFLEASIIYVSPIVRQITLGYE